MSLIKALSYARVSTPEQAEADLSIPAQLKAIRAYAENNGMVIVKEYVDEGVSAYHDEGKRFGFKALIQHAISASEVSKILVHDTSRFFRNKYKSYTVKYELSKYGVTVTSVTNPYDTQTVDGIWREAIDESMAMTSSMVTAFHVRKGMSENASKRDPETGYCYKNGGRAPFGYKLKRVHVGKDRRGKDCYKCLWEVNPKTAPILRQIVVDWRVGEGLSYKRIRDRLNSLNIPGPEGKPWGTSTLVEMIRENRLMQYTGIYYWNKEDHNTKGKRYKDKSEWVEVSNAHPPILSIEEVKAALAVSLTRQPRTPAARSYDSRWLLTGLNLEGKPFFTCKRCSGNMIGVSRSIHHAGKYCCGNHHYKGSIGCNNAARVNSHSLESKLISIIENTFGTPESVENLFKKLNSRIQSNIEIYHKSIASIENELRSIEKKIDFTFEALYGGLDAQICNERIERLKAQRIQLFDKLESLNQKRPVPLTIDPEKAREFFSNTRKVFESGTNEQKRTLFKTYIRHMELDSDTGIVNVTLYPLYLQEKLKRGDNSSLHISTGVGGGT
ncbi:MAG: recombinase family protein [Bacillota bacterium]